MRPDALLPAVLLLAVVCSGCAQAHPFAGAFLDAQVRVVGSQDARLSNGSKIHDVVIPDEAEDLHVRVSLVTDGDLRVFLTGPEVHQEADLVFHGKTMLEGHEWFQRARPEAGIWNVVVDADEGQAYYAFGFYWTLTRPASGP